MEIKENSQKKVLLSVLGVAILVVAVVGISFAAWSATQKGNANTITTGTLMVSYQEDSQAIDIQDAIPMSDAQATAATALAGAKENFAFSVSTKADAALTIPYTITLTPTTSAGDGQTALADADVHVNLTKDGTTVTGYPKAIGSLTASTDTARSGSYVLTSDEHAYTAAGTKTTNYVLKMWVADTVDTGDKVYIYSAKVNVDSAVAPIS